MKDNPFKIQEGVVHDRSLPGYRHRAASGDTMFFLPAFAGWLGRTIRLESVGLLYSFLILLFASLFLRVTYVQLIEGANYWSIAERNRIKIVELKAPRGIIYDRNGIPLVKNVPRFTLYLHPQHIKNETERDALQRFILERFPNEASNIQSVFEHYTSLSADMVLVENIPHEKAIQMYSEVSRYPALSVAYEPWRLYTKNAGLSHSIGYIGRISEKERASRPELLLTDSIGKEGLERSYDAELRGVNGKLDIEVDVFGHAKKEVTKNVAQSGHDLTTTIDLELQEKLFEILRSVIEQNNKHAGGAIIMDPYEGEVLAAVSYPSYDPNVFLSSLTPEAYAVLVNDPAKPLFNRIIAGEYPPGSTFKMVVAAAALEEGTIDDRFTVISSGGLYLGGTFFPDWKAGGHGLTNIYEAIANSVNTFFYIIGGGYGAHDGVGAERIAHYAHRFGFGEKSNIDIAGEQPGYVPSPSDPEHANVRWYQGDTFNLSIGQGSLVVTPLQVARYTAALANGGTLVTPHLRLDAQMTTAPLGLTTQVMNIIRESLHRTILSGTAMSLQSVRAAVAGKTGTAQFSRAKEPHSWFSGFAPYEAPTLVITVFIEEGGDKGLAVTCARKFLEWYFNDYKLDPVRGSWGGSTYGPKDLASNGVDAGDKNL